MGLLTSIAESRATQPSGLANPSGWLIDMFGGLATRAGRRVTPDTALTNSAVWNAVRILAGTLASLPLFIYRRTANGGKERAVDHPLHRLLHTAPNPQQTSYEWREMIGGHLELRGNAYTLIENNRRGEVTALWPLHPARMSVLVDRDDQLWYAYQPKSGERQVFKEEEIIHNRGFSLDGIMGVSPIGLMREGIGVALAAEEHAASFYGNGTLPGGVLTHPKTLSTEAQMRLQESWEKRHSGVGKAWRPAILEEGMTWTTVGMSAKDAQFLESRKFQIEEMARVFDMPLHMLKAMDRSTFNNIEHQDIAFMKHTMRRRLVALEQRMNVSLLLERERKEYFCEFLVDGVLRGDQKSRYEAYAIGRQWGWLSADDVREYENQNALPEDKGKIYLTPGNMMPAGEQPAPAKPAAAPNADPPEDPVDDDEDDEDDDKRARRYLDAYEPVLLDAFARASRKELIALERRSRTGGDAGDVLAWHAQFWREHELTVAEQLMPAISGLLRTMHGVRTEDALRAVAIARAAAVREREASIASHRELLATSPAVSSEDLIEWHNARASRALERERSSLLSALLDGGSHA